MVETLYSFRFQMSCQSESVKRPNIQFHKIPKGRNLLIFRYTNLVCIAKRFCQINTGQGIYATAITKGQ